MAYAYLGATTLIYQDYLDDATGKMLVAEPGGTYSMSAITNAPVPPSDGRWAAVQPPPPASPPAPPVPPAPAPTGGDE